MIGKSDTCTREELATFKARIREQLRDHQINVYNFPGAEEGGEEASLVPFAVVGSNTVLRDDHGMIHTITNNIRAIIYLFTWQARKSEGGNTPGAQ